MIDFCVNLICNELERRRQLITWLLFTSSGWAYTSLINYVCVWLIESYSFSYFSYLFFNSEMMSCVLRLFLCDVLKFRTCAWLTLKMKSLPRSEPEDDPLYVFIKQRNTSVIIFSLSILKTWRETLPCVQKRVIA